MATQEKGSGAYLFSIVLVAVLEESPICKMVKERYASFDSGLGKKFEEGKASLEDLYEYARKNANPVAASGKQELCETILNLYAK